MNNLVQMDRHQSDLHRLPGTHQEQNAAHVQAEAHRRIAMPVEPDTIEKKNIDPANGRRDLKKKKGGKRKQTKIRSNRLPPYDPEHLVDLRV